jgi:hypothetical protein
MILVKKMEANQSARYIRVSISSWPDIDTRAVYFAAEIGRAAHGQQGRSLPRVRSAHVNYPTDPSGAASAPASAYRVAGQASFNSCEVDVLPTNKNTTSKHVQDYNVLLESKDISNFKKARRRSWFKQ